LLLSTVGQRAEATTACTLCSDAAAGKADG